MDSIAQRHLFLLKLSSVVIFQSLMQCKHRLVGQLLVQHRLLASHRQCQCHMVDLLVSNRPHLSLFAPRTLSAVTRLSQEASSSLLTRVVSSTSSSTDLLQFNRRRTPQATLFYYLRHSSHRKFDPCSSIQTVKKLHTTRLFPRQEAINFEL